MIEKNALQWLDRFEMLILDINGILITLIQVVNNYNGRYCCSQGCRWSKIEEEKNKFRQKREAEKLIKMSTKLAVSLI